MRLTRDMWCRAGKWIGICLAAMAFGWIALAQAVSTTTVQGTVYLANGQPGSGTLQLSWPAFTTSNNLAVTAGRTTVLIGADGFVSVNLAPNLGSSPAGLYYTAVYHMSDGTTSTEYWVVPAAAQATIASVRSQVMPAAQAVQAVSKAYVDQAIESLAQGSLSPVGGTLTSPLYLNGDPSQPLQAADKHYVDETYSAAVPLSGGNMVGALAAPSVTASLNKVLLVTAAPYNAKCDGVTDDQAAIQAAFNDATRYGSFQVQFPAGTCLTSTILIQGQSFFGAGKNATIIKGEPGQDVFQGYDPSSGNTMFQHARIHDMTILVDGTLDTSATAAGGNNTYPFRITGTAGGLTALASPPAPGPLTFSPAINNCGGQIIADGSGRFDEFYLPCASFTMIGAFPVVGAPITIYDSTGTMTVLSTTIKSVVDDQHLILKASVSSAQSNLAGTFLNAHTPPWYIGSCGIALPMKDGNTGNGNTSLNDWSFENVNVTVTGGIPRQSAHTCAIFVQNNNYGMHYLHINTSLQYAGIVEALPYQNAGYQTWTPDTTQYYDVNLGHHILPLITYNGTHRVFDGVSIYGGAWDSPGGMGLWALEANTGGNAGLPAYSTDASFVRYYWECFGLLSGEMERFSGVSTTFTGGSTSQCGAYNNLGPNIVPPFVNWHVSDGIFAGQIGGGLQINGDHSTLVDTEITTSSAVTDNGFENKVISSSNTSDPLQKREFYANPGMAQEPVGKVNGDFLLNGNSGSPFVSGSDLLTTCRDYRSLTSMCVNDPNGMELVKSYIHAPATGGTVSGISTGSVAVWNYLMVAGSRIPLTAVYVIAQGRCAGASSCSSTFLVRDRVTGNTIGSCNYMFGSSWTIQGGPTTSPCLVNFSSVPAGDAVGWDTNSWTASGLTAVDISFVGFQPQSTDLVNEVVSSGQLASLSTANAQTFAGPLNGPSINVTGNVAAPSVNGYIYANRFATGGAGTPTSPWTSASGTGGIQEAINAAPVTAGNAAASTVYIPSGYYAITAGITITTPVNLIGAGWNSVLYVAASVGATTDIITVAPTSSAQVKGFIFSDFEIAVQSGTPGRYGINLNGANNEIQQGLIHHVNIQALGGQAAIYASGSGAAQGTPVLTTIEKSILVGGVNMTNLGDSITFRNDQFQGAGTNVFSFQTGATGFVMDDNNITNDGGTYLATGNMYAPKIINNEFETQSTFTGSNGSLLDFDGGSIVGGVISKNTFNVISPIVGSAVRLNNATGVLIEGNTFSRGAAGSTDVVLTANSTSNQVLSNLWNSGGPLSSMLSDAGSHNIGFFPFNNGTSASGPTLMNGEPLLAVGSTGTTYPLAEMDSSGNVHFFGTSGSPMIESITGSSVIRNGFNGQIVATFAVSPSSSPQSGTALSTYNLALGTARTLISTTAPTISSGFGTSPTVVSGNGTAVFQVAVGSGGSASSGVIGLPAATTGWRCTCEDATTFSTTVFTTRQTATSPTSCTVGNFSSAAVSQPWASGDMLTCRALAY